MLLDDRRRRRVKPAGDDDVVQTKTESSPCGSSWPRRDRRAGRPLHQRGRGNQAVRGRTRATVTLTRHCLPPRKCQRRDESHSESGISKAPPGSPGYARTVRPALRSPIGVIAVGADEDASGRLARPPSAIPSTVRGPGGGGGSASWSTDGNPDDVGAPARVDREVASRHPPRIFGAMISVRCCTGRTTRPHKVDVSVESKKDGRRGRFRACDLASARERTSLSHLCR